MALLWQLYAPWRWSRFLTFTTEIKFSTHLILSLWALYSIVVPECKLRTLLKVSLILAVTGPSHAVLFQILRMSSWNLMDTTAPQISSPTMNCSPSRARTRFSQQRDARPEVLQWGSLQEDCNSTFSQPDDPFATKLVGLVLPHGLDPHLEQVEVAVAGEVARLDQVTVERPELLAGAEPSYQLEILVEIVALLPGVPPAVPQAILRLEPMVTLRDGNRSESYRLHLQVHCCPLVL